MRLVIYGLLIAVIAWALSSSAIMLYGEVFKHTVRCERTVGGLADGAVTCWGTLP